METDLAIGPAGDVWVMNNYQDIDSCFSTPDEAPSTRRRGQDVTIFFGMAKPVRAPQIGPARPSWSKPCRLPRLPSAPLRRGRHVFEEGSPMIRPSLRSTLLGLLAALAGPAAAQTAGGSGDDAAAPAKRLANPVADLMSVPLQFN